MPIEDTATFTTWSLAKIGGIILDQVVHFGKQSVSVAIMGCCLGFSTTPLFQSFLEGGQAISRPN
jgi:hypothetical protein